jgi:hypothetical protein
MAYVIFPKRSLGERQRFCHVRKLVNMRYGVYSVTFFAGQLTIQTDLIRRSISELNI